jgi:hypothetical protein
MGGAKERIEFKKQYFCPKCQIPLKGFWDDAAYGKLCMVCGHIPEGYPKPVGEKEVALLILLNDLNLIGPL